MKYIRFLLTLLITLVFLVGLNFRFGQIPPLGRFMNPFKGFWQNAESIDYRPQAQLPVNKLKDSVNIFYDKHDIPHIFAQNSHDLFMAQGYITAQHRLWQMEFQVFAAGGRVSELIGKDALQYDRLQRRKGMLYAAKNAVKEMEKDPASKLAIEAYTKGVNAYINSLTFEQYPLEYKLLDYKPELWSPLKTALLLKFMANDLSYSERDLENTNALKLLGKDTFNLLYPEVPSKLEPVVSKKSWPFDAKPVKNEQLVLPEQFASVGHSITQWELFPQNDHILGSNNWAISGSKTASGNPILANDPLLGLRLPSIWFLTHLHSPQVNVMGASLPGAPAVIIGFNDSIAWGVTNAKRDVKDWYAIQFKDEQIRNEYAYDEKWLRTEKVIETFKVRGSESFSDTILYTHYGPVVYDKYFKKTKIPQNYALRWTAHDPSNEMLTFLKLNQATNYDEYVNALQHYQCPAQNFAFASANGDIALRIQGKFVNKWPEQGKFLMDGSVSSQEWQGFIPTEHNAFMKNPARGFVSSANQYPVDTTYPYYVYDYKYENYRNQRINQVLSQKDKLSIEKVKALQNDNYSQKAAEALPVMLNILEQDNLNEQEQQLVSQLEQWDYMADTSQLAPTIFDTWRKNFAFLLWDEFRNDSIALYAPHWATTVDLMKNHPQLSFYDIANTPQKENLQQVLLQAFQKTAEELNQWSEKKGKPFHWGEYKPTLIQHLARLPAFSEQNIPIGGNSNIVNANYGNHGVSWRLVVEMGDTIKAWGIYPGGQSGNPGSHRYANMIKSWSQGEYIPLEFYNDWHKAQKTSTYSQVLNPQQP